MRLVALLSQGRPTPRQLCRCPPHLSLLLPFSPSCSSLSDSLLDSPEPLSLLLSLPDSLSDSGSVGQLPQAPRPCAGRLRGRAGALDSQGRLSTEATHALTSPWPRCQLDRLGPR